MTENQDSSQEIKEIDKLVDLLNAQLIDANGDSAAQGNEIAENLSKISQTISESFIKMYQGEVDRMDTSVDMQEKLTTDLYDVGGVEEPK